MDTWFNYNVDLNASFKFKRINSKEPEFPFKNYGNR